jgi:serine protease AprX
MIKLPNRRFSSPLLVVILGLLLWAAAPAGQESSDGAPTLSSDLQQAKKDRKAGYKYRVIVQGRDGLLETLSPKQLRKLLKKGGAAVLEVDRQELEELRRNPLVRHISGDLTVTSDMAVTNAITRATEIWQGTSGTFGLPVTPGNTGAGVGIAILDSGIAPHEALDGRVVERVNLVSDENDAPGDAYGHGTHIAGTVAGNRTAASSVTPAFAGGSAPAATLIDVRVLGSTGAGRTSDVIDGIDWVIDHAAAFNIRVINLSLGHPVTEPSATDPLCRAVARAVAAGITVVVSAGNYGQTSAGEPVLGGITSPGNSPLALTVGAIDTKGTRDTADDELSRFSSKGPTRYEGIVKPDVVAPGTRLVSLEARRSYVSRTYPQWHIAGSGKNAYLRLSGTSMATAVVSGGVALLLNAQPSLSPAQVKLAMQMGARFMPEAGLVGAGAGRVDFVNALRVAQAGGVLPLSSLDRLLGGMSGLSFRDNGTLIDRLYSGSGLRRLQAPQIGPLLRDADRLESGILNLAGLTNPVLGTAPNYVVWGNTAGWADSYYVVWGNTIATPSGQYVVWGNNSYTDSTYVVWGNQSKTDSTYVVWGNSFTGGR